MSWMDDLRIFQQEACLVQEHSALLSSLALRLEKWTCKESLRGQAAVAWMCLFGKKTKGDCS